jgi:hypothetical protein
MELDVLKKKMNREHGVNGSPVQTVPKQELIAARDEIKGLK